MSCNGGIVRQHTKVLPAASTGPAQACPQTQAQRAPPWMAAAKLLLSVLRLTPT